MTISLAPTIGVAYQGFTNGGLPLNAGLIYTYIAGGTTPQATFTTSAGNVQNANPIVLDASGRTPAEVWLTDGVSYRFDIYDKSYDGIQGIVGSSALAASGGSALVGFLQSGTGAVAYTLQAKDRQIVSVMDFGAVGNGTADDTAPVQNAINSLNVSYGGTILLPKPAGNGTGSFKVGSLTIPSGMTGLTLQGDTSGGSIFSFTGTTTSFLTGLSGLSFFSLKNMYTFF